MKNILMFLVATLMSCHIIAQNTVTGTVIDGSDKSSVIGASVLVKGTTNNGAMTDINGQFTIKLPSGKSTLVISSVGYKSQEVNVAGKKVVQITLMPDTKLLDEVVVVGYGVQKKKLVTGATLQIKGDNLEKMNTTGALDALQSQSPGLSVVQASGQPGSGYKVNIRGMGTMGSYAPLYVIDGAAGGDINSLNPADIESIDVLKDAASCAIYGARAANGVILVTTKSGKSGKINVSYDGYYGWQNVYKMPELLNAKQYMDVMDQISYNQGNDVKYTWDKYMSAERLEAYRNGTDSGTNWLEAIRNNNAPITNHALNITGGNDVSKFSLGVSYTNQEGVFGKPVQSKYERTTVRLNSDHVIYKANNRDIITFGETLNYSYKTNGGIGVGNQYWNDISNCLRAYPIVPIYNSDGTDYYMWNEMQADGINNYNSSTPNPVADMVFERGNNISKAHALNMVAYLKIQPIKGLTFKSQFGYRMSSSSYRQYTPIFQINSTSLNAVDKVQQSGSQGWSYTIDNTLNYVFNVGKHNIDALVGQSFEKSGMGESLSASSSDMLFNGWDYAWLSNAQSTKPTVTGSPWGESALASFFGRVNWNYNETYMASAIIRADGSSVFARGHRWGWFPSFSAGWVVSNEKFMDGARNFMDFFKIRGSWGQNGNCNVSTFQYLSTFSFDNTAAYTFGTDKTTRLQGSYNNIIPNPNITWEKSEQLDFGFDARFLNSRLGMNFDWYKKTTKGWLVQAPILDTAGTNAPYINGGNVENSGFELGFNWNDKVGKDFTYGVNLNLAYNKNKVTKLANNNGYIMGATDVLSQSTAACYRVQVGEPIGYFYGYKTAGVFQNQSEIAQWVNDGNPVLSGTQPGDLKFVDVDGDKAITDADKTKIGDPNPHYILGFSFNVAYKGFDLSVTTYGNFGQQVMRSYRKFMDGRQENYTTEVFDYWHGEGTSNKMPRLTAGNISSNWKNISDIYVENADFLKISNVTIGYDFKKLWKASPLSQMRVYATVQNLYTFTGYKGMDPEVGASGSGDSYSWARGIDLGYYPQPRTVLVGVNLKF
jgi:TonB-linked SusC/RagA family outer membrane protein